MRRKLEDMMELYESIRVKFSCGCDFWWEMKPFLLFYFFFILFYYFYLFLFLILSPLGIYNKESTCKKLDSLVVMSEY